MKKIKTLLLFVFCWSLSYGDDFIVISGNSKIFIPEGAKLDTPFIVGNKSVTLWYGASAYFIGTEFDAPTFNKCRIYGGISDAERTAVSNGKEYKYKPIHYLYDADKNKLYILKLVK